MVLQLSLVLQQYLRDYYLQLYLQSSKMKARWRYCRYVLIFGWFKKLVNRE